MSHLLSLDVPEKHWMNEPIFNTAGEVVQVHLFVHHYVQGKATLFIFRH